MFIFLFSTIILVGIITIIIKYKQKPQNNQNSQMNNLSALGGILGSGAGIAKTSYDNDNLK